MGWDVDFVQRSRNRELIVTVVGLGYVGLPTLMGFYDSGFNVRGIDKSPDVIQRLNSGKTPLIDDVLETTIPHPLSERWSLTTNFDEAIPDSDIVIVTVPTPIDENLKPNLSYVKNAGINIFDNIKKGSKTIVVLESTVYPGVTKQIWLPLLEERNLIVDEDVVISYCPERFSPGDPKHGVRQVARVIGADHEIIGKDLVEFYSCLTEGDVSYVGKIEVAEASKVVENVQRDINIALVNELARIFPELGVDVEDVLTAAESKWNFHRYTPGVGVGGHCIPVDPYYLKQRAEDVGVPAELISAARSVNRSMPKYVSNTISKILSENNCNIEEARILFLGWSYKPKIGDIRQSPAMELAKFLKEKHADIFVIDPYINYDNLPDYVNKIEDLMDVEKIDIIVMNTAHPEFESIDWNKLMKKMRNKIIYDGRRVLPVTELEQLGWIVHAIGKPSN